MKRGRKKNLTRRIVKTSKRKPRKIKGRNYKWVFNPRNKLWVKIKKVR